ncbi:MAG: AMP-binding protein, partial [Synergistaceae bacterium]|nr:AMP-binding protein [Synergistaceae bacterium]
MTERLETVMGNYLDSEPESKCFWWNGAWHNRAFLEKLVEETTETLRASGFSEGQRLVALMPNSPMILALSLAVWRLGGSFCPLNHKSGLQSLTATLSLLDPCAVVLSDETREGIEGVLNERGWPSIVCPPMGPLPEFRGRTTDAESRDIAVIFSTSGTTGMPKAVPVSHANLLDNCRGSYDILDDLEEGDVLLNVLPNFHGFGYMAGNILPFVMNGAQAIVPNFLPPSKTLSAIVEAPANVVILVPMMLNFLLGLIEKGAPKPEGIKLL